MGKWSDEVSSGGNYISLKIGTDVTVEIIDIKKITNKPDYEPKSKDDVRQGFVFEFITDLGTFSVGTYTLQGALKDAEVDIGDKIRIQHPATGEYTVTKV